MDRINLIQCSNKYNNMKNLKRKTNKALKALDEIKGIPGLGDLFFSALPEETKRDLYKAIDHLKTFHDNIPVKK